MHNMKRIDPCGTPDSNLKKDNEVLFIDID